MFMSFQGLFVMAHERFKYTDDFTATDCFFRDIAALTYKKRTA